MDKRFFEFPAKMSDVIAIFGIYETWAMSVIPGSSYNFNVTTPKGNLNKVSSQQLALGHGGRNWLPYCVSSFSCQSDDFRRRCVFQLH